LAERFIQIWLQVYKMKIFLKKQSSFYIFGYIIESCIDMWAFACGVTNMATTRGFGEY
jgi:hypothetical protein